MDYKHIKEIGGLFVTAIREKDMQGMNVLNDPNKVDYKRKLLLELDKLENANSVKKDELLILSKFIRNRLWQSPDNTQKLYVLLHETNSAFGIIGDIIGYDLIYNIDGILEYVSILAKHKDFYSTGLDIVIFEDVTDDILKEDQGNIIK